MKWKCDICDIFSGLRVKYFVWKSAWRKCWTVSWSIKNCLRSSQRINLVFKVSQPCNCRFTDYIFNGYGLTLYTYYRLSWKVDSIHLHNQFLTIVPIETNQCKFSCVFIKSVWNSWGWKSILTFWIVQSEWGHTAICWIILNIR